MSKPFNIHDWQAKQRQQRLDEQYYVTVNRGRGSGKRLVRSAESDYEEPRVFSSYGEAEAYVKQAKSGGATPGQIASYWVSDENMNRIEDPVVAKGDGMEITKKEMEMLHKNGRVKLKNGSVLVYMKETVDEHHGDDFPKGLLKKSVDKFLDDLKKKSEKDYDKVEDIMKKHFNVDEASMTGTGASFTAGTGAAYATPYAFKKKRKDD
jgi:hypothetical protein